ncbi:MAG: hypothetical protein HY078_01535 [Elusimicrobia bacterium]|nr:hypothetical protein [Elusimicrobiota bacterium]
MDRAHGLAVAVAVAAAVAAAAPHAVVAQFAPFPADAWSEIRGRGRVDAPRIGRAGPTQARPIVIAGRPMAVDTDGSGGGGGDRNHRSHTSYRYASGASLNASVVRYVVLPLKPGWLYWDKLQSVQLGDFACVEHGGKRSIAVAGDRGPGNRSKFGEGSLALAKYFMPSASGNNGIGGGVTYAFYPGSGGGGRARNQAELLQRMNAFAAQVGCGRGSARGRIEEPRQRWRGEDEEEELPRFRRRDDRRPPLRRRWQDDDDEQWDDD